MSSSTLETKLVQLAFGTIQTEENSFSYDNTTFKLFLPI